MACGGDDDAAAPEPQPAEPAAEATTSEGEEAEAEEEEEEGHEDAGRAIEASAATITVDGDTSDWEGVAALDVTLEPIEAVSDVEEKTASVRVAHDDENIYVLLEVEDDYNWSADDAHLSAASAIMWSIESAAGPHMGAEDDSGAPGLGAVDIWHWELECAAGEEHGGAVSDAGDGEPGNDAGCNFDDEVAMSATERDDDNGSGAENSLLGVWTHTDATADAAGTWIFEACRPLQTGDEGDAQFAVDETARLALAYWDPDNGAEGWDDAEHVQSSEQGWIEVTLTG